MQRIRAANRKIREIGAEMNKAKKLTFTQKLRTVAYIASPYFGFLIGAAITLQIYPSALPLGAMLGAICSLFIT